MQTHREPSQVLRLCRALVADVPGSHILVHHNPVMSSLPLDELEALGNVHVRHVPANRGNWSLMKGYLEGVAWAKELSLEYEWFINLSGQCFPTQPLSAFARMLEASAHVDGYMEYFDVLSDGPDNKWSRREGTDRYLYNYCSHVGTLPRWQRGLLKPVRTGLAGVQSRYRLETSYGLWWGVATAPPLRPNETVFAGSYFKVLRRACAEWLLQASEDRADLVAHYARTQLPEESFAQTLIVNSGLWNISPQSLWHIDWTNARHGHPNTLRLENLSHLASADKYFARKFDQTVDKDVLDVVERWVVRG